MLANLTVSDIVLIGRATIEFGGGLSALTGETGAGKSILLDALSLALGGRGDAGLVRSGCRQGQVTALFELELDHPVAALLDDNGVAFDGSLVLRRVQSVEGKTRGFANDQPVSAGLLKALGGMLVEIHGQHDDRALVDPAGHRRLLDAFGDLHSICGEVAARYRAQAAAIREVEHLSAEVAEAQQEAAYLTEAVAELEALAPEPGEEQLLADRRKFLMAAEAIAGELDEALEIVGGAGSPIPDLAGLLRRMQRTSDEAASLMAPAAAALGAALDGLEDVRAALHTARQDAEFDHRELELAEERLFALRAAARKYRCRADDLVNVAVDHADRLASLDAGQERLADLQAAADRDTAAYLDSAARLSNMREQAAAALQEAVNRELPPLKLEAAEFIVQVSRNPQALSPDGQDSVAFHVRTNPGTRAGPLMKVASGGELSRFLLALKVVLADRGSAPTLIFDEIDTGAGGAVADAIGQRLARLADTVQVLSVTHAPQVAARADRHFLISKVSAEKGSKVATDIRLIEASERREEIARMLSGATITEEARAAADRLMSVDKGDPDTRDTGEPQRGAA